MAKRGKDVERRIQSFVDQADRDKHSIEVDVHKIQVELTQIGHQKLALVERIADTQIQAFINGESVNDVTGRLAETLRLREAEYEGLEAEMNEAREALKRAELELATNETMHREKAASSEQDLANDPALAQLKKQYADLSLEVEELELLAQSAKSECRKKLVGFVDDPYFQHLMVRKYDTPDYKGMGLARVMDNWLAKKIDFKQSRHDYTTLNRLPETAENRLSKKRYEHTDAKDRLDNLLIEIKDRHGVIEAHTRFQNARRRLEARRQDIANIQGKLNEHLNGLDPMMQTIRGQLSESLTRFSLPTLERMTKSTNSNGDDQAIAKYKQLCTDEEKLMLEEQTLRVRLREVSDTFRRSKELRDHFVRNDYEERNFKDSFDITAFVSGYIAGSFTRNDVDRQVRDSSSLPSYDYDTGNSLGDSFGGWSTGDSLSDSSRRSSSGGGGWSTGDSLSSGGSSSSSDSSSSSSTSDSF